MRVSVTSPYIPHGAQPPSLHLSLMLPPLAAAPLASSSSPSPPLVSDLLSVPVAIAVLGSLLVSDDFLSLWRS